MTPHVALITIGQSGRPDLGADILPLLPPDTQVTICGALDDLSTDDIAASPPTDGADTLFTRLRDGTAVTVSHKTITAGVNRRLAELERNNIHVALLLCTGVFQGLRFSGTVLYPSDILHAVARAGFSGRHIGVLVPLAAQIATLPRKWDDIGTVDATALRPGSDADTIDAAIARLTEKSPDIIVMDCMGYTAADKARVRQSYTGPVLLAATAAGRVMGEWI